MDLMCSSGSKRVNTSSSWPFICNFCSYSTKWRNNFNRHMTKHSDVRPFMCTICNSSFKVHEYLKIHMLTHTGELPFQCNICFRRFRQRCHLNCHRSIHFVKGLSPFDELSCWPKRKYKSLNIDTMGQESAYTAYLFTCELCSYSTSLKANLKNHQRKHSDVRPFACSECSKKFKFLHVLKRHLHTHTDLPFECSVCFKRFRRKVHLRCHQKLHF